LFDEPEASVRAHSIYQSTVCELLNFRD